MTADNEVPSTPEPGSATVADPADPYLSTVKVARIFSVTTETIRDWIERGTLAGHKINGRWYVRQSEVIRLANHKYGSN